MDETEFHRLADVTLGSIADTLEKADESGLLEVEQLGGIVTISVPSGKQFIVSKHAPTRQIWLSSPISGGLHFAYDEAAKDWILPSGRSLGTVLSAELQALAGVALA